MKRWQKPRVNRYKNWQTALPKFRCHRANRAVPQKPTEIPTQAIASYVDSGRKSFSKLVTSLKREIADENLLLRDLKSGEIGLDFAQDGRALEAVVVRRGPDDRGKWYFRSSRVKESMVTKQQERIRGMGDTYSVAKGGLDDESLVSVLTNAGPKLDTRMAKTIGFIRDATVLEVIDNVVLLLYDDKPYFALLDSSAGLYPGDKILPAPFYVSGTVSIRTTDGAATFTLLQQVTLAQIQKQVGAASTSSVAAGSTEAPSTTPLEASDDFANTFSSPADGGRTWTSRNGHQIRAVLLSKTATHVKLKRTDNGKVIEVPLKDLSDSDLSFLKKN